MKKFMVSVIISIGLISGAFAQSQRDTHPPISLMAPSSGSTQTNESKFVVLVIESAHISHEGAPISAEGLVAYLNATMSTEEAPYLAVHIREGITYGDFVNAVDVLRKTNTKSISISLKEVPRGREV
jgi:biopolymer transport protein ExbD